MYQNNNTNTTNNNNNNITITTFTLIIILIRGPLLGGLEGVAPRAAAGLRRRLHLLRLSMLSYCVRGMLYHVAVYNIISYTIICYIILCHNIMLYSPAPAAKARRDTIRRHQTCDFREQCHF